MVDYSPWSYFRRAPHPRMVRLDRRRLPPLSEPLGFAVVWSNFFLHHRPAPAARDLRCGGVDCDLAGLLSRLADCRPRRDYRTLLAFCRSGLDVCRTLDLSAQHLEVTNGRNHASSYSLDQRHCEIFAGLLCVARHRWRRSPLGLSSLFDRLAPGHPSCPCALQRNSGRHVFHASCRRAAKLVLDPHSCHDFCSATDEHDLVGQFPLVADEAISALS